MLDILEKVILGTDTLGSYFGQSYSGRLFWTLILESNIGHSYFGQLLPTVILDTNSGQLL